MRHFFSSPRLLGRVITHAAMQCNRGMSPGQAMRLASERTLNGRDYPCNKCGVYLGTRPGNTLTKRKTNHPYALKNAARHGWDCEVIWRRENRR